MCDSSTDPTQIVKDIGSAATGMVKDVGSGAARIRRDVLNQHVKEVKIAGENLFGRPQSASERADQIARDAEAARRKVEADATMAANQELLARARRRRANAGLLSTEAGTSVLASGGASAPSTVLGSGGV